jgi:predicted nucleic acid-binding protein
MTYLLDSSVSIDVLNGRNERPGILADLSQQDRAGLEFYPVTWEAAQLAGDLYRQWRQ